MEPRIDRIRWNPRSFSVEPVSSESGIHYSGSETTGWDIFNSYAKGNDFLGSAIFGFIENAPKYSHLKKSHQKLASKVDFPQTILIPL